MVDEAARTCPHDDASRELLDIFCAPSAAPASPSAAFERFSPPCRAANPLVLDSLFSNGLDAFGGFQAPPPAAPGPSAPYDFASFSPPFPELEATPHAAAGPAGGPSRQAPYEKLAPDPSDPFASRERRRCRSEDDLFLPRNW
jgi:hypothetical protein